jgi:hypothetical protein
VSAVQQLLSQEVIAAKVIKLNSPLKIKVFTLTIFIYLIILLSSCGVSNKLVSQESHYKLHLVKAGNPHLFFDNKATGNTVELTAIPQHIPLVSYHSNEQIELLNTLLKSDVNELTKQTKKSNPIVYGILKRISISKMQYELKKQNYKVASHQKTSDDSNELDIPWDVILPIVIILVCAALAVWFFILGGILLDVLAVLFSIVAALLLLIIIMGLTGNLHT